MTELLTAAQMRAVETAAIESGEVTGLELMERAGRGVVAAIFEEWPELRKTAHKAVVLCGPGNNGGDGFVVARLLKEWGWEVEVFLYGDPAKLPPDAKVNYERWLALGPVSKYEDDTFEVDEHFKQVDLFVDALFGTGLGRSISDCATLCQFIEDITCYHEMPAKVVSIDIPSGLDSDSGKVLPIAGSSAPHCIVPNLCVSFHSEKLGHRLDWGASVCGNTVVKDIGLDGSDQSCATELVRLVDGSSLNQLEKTAKTHKYCHGHALILSGGSGKTGAARLAARGALRIGAGLVTLGVPGSAQMEVAAQVTAIMIKRAGTPDEVMEALRDARFNALCLGPGLGVDRARELVPVALRVPPPESGSHGGGPGSGPGRAVVLDADALTAFAADPDALFGMLHEGCVLTPHGGEFARLFPDIAEKLNATPFNGPAYSKVDATREAAKRAGCVVLFKGPDTVIADPDGRCSINSAQYARAAPWLATAGSGDVLAGFITGLLARGFNPMRAAETAAWLHVECARLFGPGLIAEDIPEELPKVLRGLAGALDQG